MALHLLSLTLVCSFSKHVTSFTFRPSSSLSHAACPSTIQPASAAAPLFSSPLPTPTDEQEQILDDYLPPSHPLVSLLAATADVSDPRQTQGELKDGSSRPPEFRYEWGTWIDQEKLSKVMEALGEIRLNTGVYEGFMDGNYETTLVGHDDAEEASVDDGGKDFGKRIRIASGKHWDVILYALPKGA